MRTRCYKCFGAAMDDCKDCERIYAMTVQEYQDKARRTGLNQEERILHAALGLTSEASEVSGILQKKYQGHPVDRDHLIKELGDCLWMIAEACDAIDVPMEYVMAVNIKKLEERFPEGFSAEKSLHRKEGDI